MSIFSIIYGFLVYGILKAYLPFHLSLEQIFFFYFIIGTSYSLGELPNSFMKRQVSVLPGYSYPNGQLKIVFKLFDTFDSLIAIGICYYIFFNVDFKIILITILIGGFIHLLTDRLMKVIGLKKPD